MKPSKEQFAAAVESLAAVPMFPGEPRARLVIAEEMSRMVGTVDGLRWLMSRMLAEGRWQGFGAMRALYTQRFPPADGNEGPERVEGVEAKPVLPGGVRGLIPAKQLLLGGITDGGLLDDEAAMERIRAGANRWRLKTPEEKLADAK